MKKKLLYSFVMVFTLCMGLMLMLRIIFWTFNRRFFPAANLKEKMSVFMAGSRFDASSVALILLPCLLLYTIYLVTANKRWLQLMLLLLKVLLFVLISLSLFDTGYYAFSFQRSSIEMLQFTADSLRVFKTAPLAYAGLFAMALVLVVGVHFLLRRFTARLKVSTAFPVKHTLLFLPVFLFLFICIRGWNARPLSPLSVSLYTNANYSSIVTNTLQTFLYSAFKSPGNNWGNPKQFYPFDTVTKTVPFVQQLPAIEEKKYNVVLFIMESVSRAYLEKGDPQKASTPFLDTLMSNSLVCTNAYANGSMSVNGIQAVLSGIPALYDYNIDNSPYYLNFTRAMPAVFKERGYGTYFYYGAGKDHFGLEKLTRRFGVDHYISEEAYGNKAEHNGYWGINDSAFFRFTVEQVAKQPQPFFTTVFNISTHYPYVIPEKYRSVFPKGNTAAAQSVSFLDRALQLFFEEAKKSSWYNNTLFVFTADHWNKEDPTLKADGSGIYQIPLFIYKPDGSLKQTITGVTDQLSIFPTLMHLTGYTHKFNSFGSSVLNLQPERQWTVAVKQWPGLLLFTTTDTELYFDVTNDKISRVKFNAGTPVDTTATLKTARSFIQYYDYLFRNNKLADTNHLPH
ncbi:LTA synthase family protein [Lacibacter sp. MH-610]|uniref:LTA synthase family protein n=1 Tax=Lacibacter sp. MH-610 TaxID=3020883 RepID=UPI003891BB7A